MQTSGLILHYSKHQLASLVPRYSYRLSSDSPSDYVWHTVIIFRVIRQPIQYALVATSSRLYRFLYWVYQWIFHKSLRFYAKGKILSIEILFGFMLFIIIYAALCSQGLIFFFFPISRVEFFLYLQYHFFSLAYVFAGLLLLVLLRICRYLCR